MLGGAGSGKSTICGLLSRRVGLPIYDMDAHIYGEYHARFSKERHPANWAWSSAENGLAWLLGMAWEEFDEFNRAALPEYLDLLARDLEALPPAAGVLVDGGVCNPAILARAIPVRQIVCLAAPGAASAGLWEESQERRSMKAAVYQLPNGEDAWRKFLEFDARISAAILQECVESGIQVCRREEGESMEGTAERVARLLGIR
jgi:hypothetical protein